MYIKNRPSALIYRLIALALCAYGLIIMSDIFNAGLSPTMFIFYTNISNALILLYLLGSVIFTAINIRNQKVFLPGIKRAFVMMITVTLLVYHFVLVPVVFTMNLNFEVHSLPDILVHYVTPLLFITDWLLFDEKQKIKWFDPLLWLALPFAYLVFVMIRAEVGGPIFGGSRFPYFFLDIDYLGAAQVALYVLLCLLAFTAIGYIFFLLDKIPKLAGKLPKIIRPNRT